MQNATRLSLILCAALLFPAAPRADNPIIQTVYTADPAPLVYDGRLYVYTGHDEDGSTWFTMKDWRLWSTTDMVNWTAHGAPLSLKTFSWASKDAWAGQCTYRNGKFYWYVPIVGNNGAQSIGVAVSTSPTGPFTDPIGRPLIANAQIDPTVFVDDDGQAYLYYGNPDLYYVKLNADMISYQGSPVKVNLTTQGFGVRNGTDRATSYEEAPWLFKRNSLYYMVFAGGPVSEHIAYSTAPSATGPWTYRGVVMPTQGGSFTNHSGIVDFAGGSYFFYHNGALPGGGGYTRSVAVEKFTYNSDGTIPKMNMTTAGPLAIGTLNPYATVEAETIAWESGVELETCSEGGMNVSSIENGDYIKVESVAFGTGATSFQARVASNTSGGSIQLRLDGTSGTLIGTCAVAGTGGWQTWTSVNCNVSGATGTHDLYLVFTGGSGSLFNFNWWKFTGGTTDSQPPSAPSSLASSSKTSTSVSLAWTASTDNTGVTGYQIFDGATQVATSTTTSATVSSLTPNTAYAFTVKAQDAAGNLSAASNAVSVTTLGAGPISINVGGDATGSFIADAYFSGGSTYTNTATVTAPAGVPAAIFSSERYGPFTYTFVGYAPGSAWNVTLYFAETYLTAAGQRSFDVAINGATALSAFDIYAAAGGANIGTSKSLPVTVGADGKIVVAFTAGVENPKVNAIAITEGATADTQAPTAPGAPAASSVTTTSVTLSWGASTDNVGVVGYDVYNGTALAASSASTSVNVAGLQQNTSYTFTVKAKDAAGNVSAASSAVTVRTLQGPDTQAPTAPGTPTATSVTSTTVTLSWGSSTDDRGVVAYELYAGGGLAGTSTTNSGTVGNLLPGTPYVFTIRARDAAGNVSSASGAVTVITKTDADLEPPSVPGNLSWSNDGMTVTLTWEPSTDNVGVVAYGFYYGMFYIGSTLETTAALIGFQAGTPYKFTVKAFDAAGNTSVASNEITVLLAMEQDTTPPTAPTNVVVTGVTLSSASLSWSASTDNVGVVLYQVFVDGNLAATAVGRTSAVVSGLTSVEGRLFTVKAIDAAGNVSAASVPVTVTLP